MDLQAGDVLENEQGTVVVIRMLTAEADPVEWEVTAPPGQLLLREHVHPEQLETFFIRSGHARYEVDGIGGSAGPGAEIGVPAGTRHVNPWNDGSEPLVYIQRVAPRLDFIKYVEPLGFHKR